MKSNMVVSEFTACCCVVAY